MEDLSAGADLLAEFTEGTTGEEMDTKKGGRGEEKEGEKEGTETDKVPYWHFFFPLPGVNRTIQGGPKSKLLIFSKYVNKTEK